MADTIDKINYKFKKMKDSLSTEIKFLIEKQPRIEDLKTAREIKQKLKSSRIVKVLHCFKGSNESRNEDMNKGSNKDIIKERNKGRNKNIHEENNKDKVLLVLLDNNFIAVFKAREKKARQKEILAFEIATNLFKLPHTIPPTVEGKYNDCVGVIQYYTDPDVNFEARHSCEFYNRDNMELVRQAISRDSYADFQVFKYIAALIDIKLEDLIVWKNTSNQYCLTYVDNEWILGDVHTKFGETLHGKIDITNSSFYDSIVKSYYTSLFNSSTLDVIATINRDELMSLLVLHYPEGEESFRVITDMFFQNRDSLLNAARLMQTSKVNLLVKTEESEIVTHSPIDILGTSSILSFSSEANNIANVTVSHSDRPTITTPYI